MLLRCCVEQGLVSPMGIIDRCGIFLAIKISLLEGGDTLGKV
jgi:hypothetical protein